jgi:hypothetical protein
MTIRATWDNTNKSTVRYIFYGAWTWEQMDSAVADAQELFMSVGYHVDVIVDLRESNLPTGSDMLESARKMPLIPRENNLLVFVGDPTMCQSIYATMRKLYRVRQMKENVLFTTSLEKARTMLYESTLV